MSVKQVVDKYYAAWKSGTGDFSAVALADELEFKGPMASFDSAAGFRAMAAQAGPLVTRFAVRHQFIQGSRVCSIIDYEMSPVPKPMTSAEVLEVEDGRIVRGEVIYDAEELRAAMARNRS